MASVSTPLALGLRALVIFLPYLRPIPGPDMGRPSVHVYYMILKEIDFTDSCVNEAFGVVSQLWMPEE